MGFWKVETNQITFDYSRSKLSKIGWKLIDETAMTEIWSDGENSFTIRRSSTTHDAIVNGKLSKIMEALRLIRLHL